MPGGGGRGLPVTIQQVRGVNCSSSMSCYGWGKTGLKRKIWNDDGKHYMGGTKRNLAKNILTTRICEFFELCDRISKTKKFARHLISEKTHIFRIKIKFTKTKKLKKVF